jgi:ribosomal-protein-alanine N-acetyltransferase
MKIIAETSRLILRDIELFDAFDLLEMDLDERVTKYTGQNPIGTIEEANDVVQFILNQYAKNGVGRWAVIEKQSGDFLGWTGLKFHNEMENNHIDFYDLGYRFKFQHWNKGYATEASLACLKIGFEQLKLQEIIAMVHPDNLASMHVAQKCGFEFIETFTSENSVWNWLRKSNH